MDALELGWDVVGPADCCASLSAEDHDRAHRYFQRWNMLKPTVEEAMALM